ncbi:hypothetical protein RUS47_00525 [Mycoplasmoides gallisepticum]|uniref:Conserved hypothetical lipoprotein n=1 Tax=Mycoplasmoides gallisepticum WI01_2001.043-13-2P TaxID=1159201 RepID=J3TQV2_MYCGL|nr:aromatic motif membrane protein [Mycoplasmoides gallisepticum]AFP75740.1 conserved hypothetical lipoprotein [Mycoplasmoides gallisepticum VA94_7994-1-7P]AFP76507.1 conserved hypothetical lipoprotein [Mycoplasmoides gallisepticum NC95_13295-2-2P]AFP77261.1 conserved hypothetical lipoprotein [Mycoplasmoides gallisepticum NC96_1596-4-2P]AFP78032.1 conserved hypothetical lipoprotein [Mycoplasmoides gallisepticum NY01_2001.047-5-1P]AFP78792.1 conserved hypothetical lipoprotein [Mycoplasmoides ga
MKLKTKLTKLSLIIPFAFSAASCADYDQKSKLSLLIDHSKDISLRTTSKEELVHKNIIDSLLNLIYKNTPEAQNAKEVYIHQQEINADNIKAQFKQIEEDFNKQFKILEITNWEEELKQKREELIFSRFNPEKAAEIRARIQELQDLIASARNDDNPIDFFAQYQDFVSKNWFFILNNLNIFDWNFITWALNPYYPESKKILVSEEYQNKVKRLTPFNSLKFSNTYLDDIKLGDESREIGDNEVYYLKKDKLVLRFLIRTVSAPISGVVLSYLPIYFGASRAKNISLNLISSIIHSGFIHRYETGLQQYEVDMPIKQRYGYPAFVFNFLKKDKTNEN